MKIISLCLILSNFVLIYSLFTTMEEALDTCQIAHSTETCVHEFN